MIFIKINRMLIRSKQNSNMDPNHYEMLKYLSCIILMIALLSGCLWPEGLRNQRHSRGHDIFLITIDALRADHLGCYGYSNNTSPNIDQFAQDAMLFENCLSHGSETRFSFASILSGFLPHETKIQKNHPLPLGVETVAEILQKSGYKTIAVVSNYVLNRNEGWDQGFVIYDDIMNEHKLGWLLPERLAENTTDRACELLEQFCKDQLFMWMHYQDPHGPYTPPGRFARLFQNPQNPPLYLELNNSMSGQGGIPLYQRLGMNRDFYYYVSQYDSEIRYMDEYFKNLTDKLKQLGLYDNSLIILTSDHGEGMGEHNYYFAHGENLYNSLTHVPLIIKYGKELTGRRSDFVQHMDIIPTILNIIGVKRVPRFRGLDLRKKRHEKREIFAENESDYSLVLDGLKLIYHASSNQYELFDVKTDPREKNNLINETKYRMQVKDLKIRLNRIRKEDFLGIPGDKNNRKLSNEEIEKLKSLGYVQ